MGFETGLVETSGFLLARSATLRLGLHSLAQGEQVTMGTFYPVNQASRCQQGQRRENSEPLKNSPSGSGGYGVSDLQFSTMENGRKGIYF